MKFVIKEIYTNFADADKRMFFLLIFLAIFTSIIEIIGITAIMPFINLISDMSLIESNIYYSRIYDFFNFSSYLHYVVAFGVVLIVFYIFRGVLNYIYYYSVVTFQNTQYEKLSQNLFKIYIEQSYLNYLNSNSSNLTKNIVTESYNYTLVIAALLFIFSEIIIMFILYSILIYIDWVITLGLTVFLGLSLLSISKVISPKIKTAGNNRTQLQGIVYELINSSLGNFKLLKLRDNDGLVIDKFNLKTNEMKHSYITNGSLQHFPRLFLEAFAFTFLLILIIYFLIKNDGNISDIIGSITIFVLGLYRLMPSANRIITNYNQILFYSQTVNIINKELKRDIELMNYNDNILFNKEIILKELSFFYKKDKLILKNINLKIKKGSKVAFIGPSGSGKSTLVDIIIGLNQASSGSIYIDNQKLTYKNIKSWRKKIGYIPQNIYLFEGTVAENVSMEENYNSDQVKKALKQAQILDFLNNHHDGIETLVGENGLKLSGGQRQRIAIARALYSNPEILVLDEATSALDTKVESEIMNNIYRISSNKTLIIIAHRLSTIEKCDFVYMIKDNNIVLNKE